MNVFNSSTEEVILAEERTTDEERRHIIEGKIQIEIHMRRSYSFYLVLI